MENTHQQTPAGYLCNLCGGIAVMDADGLFLCAADALRLLEANPEAERHPWDGPERKPAAVVDLTDVGEVRSTRVADTHVGSRLIRCASEFRHRTTAKRIHS